MDQLTALRALRRVVELGSFTAAGDALGISHSIVSRQVRQLESQLGAQLAFQLADLARYDGVRDAQRGAGGRETAQFHDAAQGAQGG